MMVEMMAAPSVERRVHMLVESVAGARAHYLVVQKDNALVALKADCWEF